MNAEAPHKSRASKRKRDSSFSSSSSESCDPKPKKTKSRDRTLSESCSSKKKRHRSERHKRKKHKHGRKKAKNDTETFSSSDNELSGGSVAKSTSQRKSHKRKKTKMKRPKKESLERSARKHAHEEHPEKHGAVIQTLSRALISAGSTPTTSTREAEKQAQSTTAKKRGPMTKEEWEKQQSIVRRVYDPDTGRHRLVKGDGEIVEEIVSREQQRNINRQATLGDSMSFQEGLRRLM